MTDPPVPPPPDTTDYNILAPLLGEGKRVRRSIRDIVQDYHDGKNDQLQQLIFAFNAIQNYTPKNPFEPGAADKSFFTIAGYHGMPFRGAGWGNSADWWGGYCNHGNVLFPVWHRAYVLRLENALRSIKGCEEVTVPFWDETFEDKTEDKTESGIPPIFLQRKFKLTGKYASNGESEEIHNPLYSYIFQKAVFDNIGTDGDPKAPSYTKHENYETVRYPFSGLVGSPADQEATQKHNDQWGQYGQVVSDGLLNGNIKNWMGWGFLVTKTQEYNFTGTRQKFALCLEAPNYTVFSNTSSAAQWNEDHFGVAKWVETDPDVKAVVPLEQPHNDLHLAIGGLELPQYDKDNIAGAQGDMGENDTAAFDPIFFFHHANIDRMFWLWQVNSEKNDPKSKATTELDVIPGYPGTNSIDGQGATPGVPGNSWLSMDSPLTPFKNVDGEPLLAKDVVNITSLNYEYGEGSHPKPSPPMPLLGDGAPPKEPSPVLELGGVNRGAIKGSFALHTFATIDGKRQLVDSHSVLSRWHVQGCANCQTHLKVKAYVSLPMSQKQAQDAKFEVHVHTRDGHVTQDEDTPKGKRPTYKLHLPESGI